MPSDPLSQWSGVTEWEGELKCTVSDDHDIEGVSGAVIGSSHTLGTYTASVRLSTVGGFSWSGDGSATGTWEEKRKIDASGFGFIEISKDTVDGGGSAEVRAGLGFGIDVSTNLGVYSLRSSPLDMAVELTYYSKSWSGLAADPISETTSSSTGTRTINVPIVDGPLPLDGSTITGEKTIGPVAFQFTKLISWSLRPSPNPAPTPTVEIQIRKTATSDDDLVLLACQHPRGRMKVPCRIRLTSQETNPVTVVLTTPDGRLRFPEEADEAKTLTLQPSRKWVQFQISGQVASDTVGDAVINAHLDSALGPVIGNKHVTVVSFSDPSIIVVPGGDFKLKEETSTYEVDVEPAVDFLAEATIKPAVVKCDAPQLANLYIGIMQEVIDSEDIVTLNDPIIKWNKGVDNGTTVNVNETVRVTESFDPSLHKPVADGDPKSTSPLYDSTRHNQFRPDAIVRPQGCDGGAEAKSTDSPSIKAGPYSLPVTAMGSGAIVGKVIWRHVVKVEIRRHFRTYCVLYDTVTKAFCALSQTEWHLNLDSSAANQHATVDHQGAPVTTDPATGIKANKAPKTSGAVGIGPPVPITKPRKTP
jgi:hypothetical protein